MSEKKEEILKEGKKVKVENSKMTPEEKEKINNIIKEAKQKRRFL